LLGRLIFCTVDVMSAETQAFLQRAPVPVLNQLLALPELRQIVQQVLRVSLSY
jgi:hypothetical protein